MITGLVIGPINGSNPEEIEAPYHQHTHILRAWVEHLDESLTRFTVVTYCPTIIYYAHTQCMRKRLLNPYDAVILRDVNGRDTPLLNVKEANWLAHFALGDLYLRGEFDPWLTGEASEASEASEVSEP